MWILSKTWHVATHTHTHTCTRAIDTLLCDLFLATESQRLVSGEFGWQVAVAQEVACGAAEKCAQPLFPLFLKRIFKTVSLNSKKKKKWAARRQAEEREEREGRGHEPGPMLLAFVPTEPNLVECD